MGRRQVAARLREMPAGLLEAKAPKVKTGKFCKKVKAKLKKNAAGKTGKVEPEPLPLTDAAGR